MSAELQLDAQRGAWLTPADQRRWDVLAKSPLRDQVDPSDTVLILGAGTGMASFCYRELNVKTLILVEHSPDRVEALRRSYDGAPGVILIEDAPAQIHDFVVQFRPTVLLLDLRGRETDVHVVWDLAWSMPSVDVLGILYAKPLHDRAGGLDEMLQTWADNEDERWKRIGGSRKGVFTVYTRYHLPTS